MREPLIDSSMCPIPPSGRKLKDPGVAETATS